MGIIILSTEILFRIGGNSLNNTGVNSINNIEGIRNRMQAIYKSNSYLKLVNFCNQAVQDKLILIDSSMPSILAHALIIHYKYGISSFSDISNRLTLSNPLNYDQSMGHRFYEYKLKKLIIEKLFEIMPNAWTGLYNIQGTDNRNIFENNLLKITHLKTPRNILSGIGKIYTEKEELFFKLKLQMSFIH